MRVKDGLSMSANVLSKVHKSTQKYTKYGLLVY